MEMIFGRAAAGRVRSAAKVLIKGASEPSARPAADAFAKSPVAFETVLIGSHHKTGSVWLCSVFEQFARRTDAAFVHLHRGTLSAGRRRTISFDHHSVFKDIEREGTRGLHMIRDPRDVVVSSMHYHRRSQEPWLHVPKFDGLTYQEKINTYDDTDAMLFEIDNAAGKNIADMCAFDDGDTFRTVKFEEMATDTTLERWHDALLWLGFVGLDLVVAIDVVYANSLFGAKGTSAHMRGDGGTKWQREMPERVLARFEERFPDAVATLGYR